MKNKILIDADGCPVTGITVETAEKTKTKVIIFCDTSHIFNFGSQVEVVTVGKGADSADFALVNKVNKGDIIVTQDYGLAAMALSKGGRPITQNGLEITDENLNGLLTSRHIAKKQRMAGKHLKGPSKRTAEQDKKFLKKLLEMIESENTDCT